MCFRCVVLLLFCIEEDERFSALTAVNELSVAGFQCRYGADLSRKPKSLQIRGAQQLEQWSWCEGNTLFKKLLICQVLVEMVENWWPVRVAGHNGVVHAWVGWGSEHSKFADTIWCPFLSGMNWGNRLIKWQWIVAQVVCSVCVCDSRGMGKQSKLVLLVAQWCTCVGSTWLWASFRRLCEWWPPLHICIWGTAWRNSAANWRRY